MTAWHHSTPRWYRAAAETACAGMKRLYRWIVLTILRIFAATNQENNR